MRAVGGGGWGGMSGAERETYRAPQSRCLPQSDSSARVRGAAESQSSHFYQVKRLEAPLACLVKG